MNVSKTAERIDTLIEAAMEMSAAAAGRIEDRHKFNWDKPEVNALRKLRRALMELGEQAIIDRVRHDEMS